VAKDKDQKHDVGHGSHDFEEKGDSGRADGSVGRRDGDYSSNTITARDPINKPPPQPDKDETKD
jgi:hypothetical protein